MVWSEVPLEVVALLELVEEELFLSALALFLILLVLVEC